MGDGAMRTGLLAIAGFMLFAFSCVPLLLILAFPKYGRSSFVWTVVLGCPALTLVYIAGQTRSFAGPDGPATLLYAAAFLTALSPLGLAIMKPDFRRGRPFAVVLPLIVSSIIWSQSLAQGLSDRMLKAAQAGDGEEVRRLLDEGARADCDEPGACALDLMIDAQDWKTVESLIAHDAKDATYHGADDPDMEGAGTSAARKLEAFGKQDLARRLRANAP